MSKTPSMTYSETAAERSDVPDLLERNFDLLVQGLNRLTQDVRGLRNSCQERTVDLSSAIEATALRRENWIAQETERRVRRECAEALRKEFEEVRKAEVDALEVQIEEQRRALEAARVRGQQLESEIRQLRARTGREHIESVLAEIERTEAADQKLSEIVDDPATNLPIALRKNLERSELQAYLRGMARMCDVSFGNAGHDRDHRIPNTTVAGGRK